MLVCVCMCTCMGVTEAEWKCQLEASRHSCVLSRNLVCAVNLCPLTSLSQGTSHNKTPIYPAQLLTLKSSLFPSYTRNKYQPELPLALQPSFFVRKEEICGWYFQRNISCFVHIWFHPKWWQQTWTRPTCAGPEGSLADVLCHAGVGVHPVPP